MTVEHSEMSKWTQDDYNQEFSAILFRCFTSGDVNTMELRAVRGAEHDFSTYVAGYVAGS
jgi:hypothetical protein